MSKRILIFLGLTAAFSAPFELLLIFHGGGRLPYVFAQMWSPAAAALITCRITGKPYSELGFRWDTRGALIGWLIPLGYCLATYVPVWISGLGLFYDAKFVAVTVGPSSLPAALQISAVALFAATAGVIRGTSSALGEEIGWRGFLVPELSKTMGFGGVSLVSGLIWGAWHVPIIAFASYNAGTPLWWSLPCFFLGIIAGATITASLRLRTGSLWPAAILHASHNVFVQTVFNPLTVDTGRTRWVVGEFGIGISLVAAAIAVGFWLRERAAALRSSELAGALPAIETSTDGTHWVPAVTGQEKRVP